MLALEDDLALEVVIKDSVSSFNGHPADYLGAKLGWESFDDVVGLRGGRRDILQAKEPLDVLEPGGRGRWGEGRQVQEWGGCCGGRGVERCDVGLRHRGA